MANFRIWAPWRLAYVKDASKDIEEECIFCAKPAADDDEANLIVHRGERCFVILNLFPYTNGHLMVAPYEHVGALQEIAGRDRGRDDGAGAAGDGPARGGLRARTATTSASTRAGSPAPGSSTTSTSTSSRAGRGDNNFMPVIADTKVMPQTHRAELRGSEGSVLSEQPTLAPAGHLQGLRHPRPLRRARWTRRPRTRSAAPSPACSGGCAARAGRAAGRPRPRHAADRAGDGGGAARRPDLRGRHRARRRHGRDRDALPPGRLAPARRRRDGHRLPQPEGLHRRQAGPRGGAAALRRRRHRRRQGGDRSRARPRPRRRLLRGGRHLGGVPRPRALLHRPRQGEADEGRRRRRQRDGRADGRADPGASCRSSWRRCTSSPTASSPTTSRTRCWRRTGG